MRNPKTTRIGIILNGVTGRMGTNQHLLRSIVPLIRQGGLEVGRSHRLLPDPILVGRNASKLEKLAADAGVHKWSTDLDSVLADPAYPVYFDAQTTQLRSQAVEKAIAAGKHVYVEKPSAENLEQANRLCTLARERGVKHGVVQDKLWLPGFQKLRRLLDQGFFGEVLGIRGEFGYWVFAGEHHEPQRPSWNYRREDGGGIILDMVPHWQYLVENLFGRVARLSCVASTLIKQRWDERHRPYDCTAEDSAHVSFELVNGVLAQFNFSWVVRVRRDDLFTLQVDGTKGSAVAGLRDCWIQPDSATPRPVWNPDVEDPNDYFAGWTQVPGQEVWTNAFRAQWELFLRHVALDDCFPWDLAEGARGIALAEAAHLSWNNRCWVDVA